jgi:hypothetical protein
MKGGNYYSDGKSMVFQADVIDKLIAAPEG